MMKQACGCQPDDVSTDNVAKTVETQVDNLDPQRAEAFTGLQTARSARAAGYAREQKRLALKYGADNPRVAALTQKSAFNAGLRRDLNFEADRAQTQTPTVDQNGYVFHGFVRDLKGQGVPGLTVALYNDQDQWIRELGFGCTDERGYFILRYQGTDKGQPVALKPTLASFQQVRSDTKPGAAETTSGESKPAARIYVLDANKKTLQVEPDPLYPQLGQVDFRIIVLGSKKGTCTPPPEKPGEPAPATSTPLERVRGIGPKTADKLRAAGIPDLEALLQTEGARLVEIAGFDADAVKRAAHEAVQSAPAVPETESAATPAPQPSRTETRKSSPKRKHKQ